jgi:hypothetical protein
VALSGDWAATGSLNERGETEVGGLGATVGRVGVGDGCSGHGVRVAVDSEGTALTATTPLLQFDDFHPRQKLA